MQQKAFEFCQIGNLAFLARDYTTSMENYDKALAIDALCIDALIGKGLISHDLEQFEVSLDCFDKALRIDDSSLRAINGKGLSLIKLDRLEEALDIYEYAIRVDRNFKKAYITKGVLLKRLGRYEEALKEFNNALTIDKKFLPGYLHSGWLQQSLGNFAESLNAFDKVLEIDKGYVIAYVEKGKSLTQLKSFEIAEDAFTQALAINENCVEAYLGLGIIGIVQLTANRGSKDEACVDRVCMNLFKAYSLTCQFIYQNKVLPYDVYLSFFNEQYYAPLFIEQLINNPFGGVVSVAGDLRDSLALNKKVVRAVKSHFHATHKHFAEEGALDCYYLHYGITNYLLGDPIEAYKCFDEIVDIELPSDLQGQYYFNLSAIKIQHPERAVILKNSIQSIYTRVSDHEPPVQNYYAGRILLLAGQEKEALKYFSINSENLFPSYLMKVYLLRHEVRVRNVKDELYLRSTEMNLNALFGDFMRGFKNCSSCAVSKQFYRIFDFIIYSELLLAIAYLVDCCLPNPICGDCASGNSVADDRISDNISRLRQWKSEHESLQRKEIILQLFDAAD